MASGLYFKDTCRNKDFFNCVVVGEHNQMTIPVPVCLIPALMVTLQLVKDPRDLFQVVANKQKNVPPLHIVNIVTKEEQDVDSEEFDDYISDIWTTTESDEVDSYVMTLMNTRQVLDTGIVSVTPDETSDILELNVPEDNKLLEMFTHPTKVLPPREEEITDELLIKTAKNLGTTDTIKISRALEHLATYLLAIDDANNVASATTLLKALKQIKVPKSQDETEVRTKVSGMIHYLQEMIDNE